MPAQYQSTLGYPLDVLAEQVEEQGLVGLAAQQDTDRHAERGLIRVLLEVL